MNGTDYGGRLFLSLALLLGCILPVFGCKRTAELSAQLQSTEGTVVQLGVVDEGTDIEGSFSVWNAGNQPITVNSKIGVSCSCTGAQINKTVLGGGESARVSFKLSPPGLGEGTAKFTVFPANDGVSPLTVTASYFVRTRWDVTPTRMVLSGKPLSKTEAECRVRSGTDPGFRVISVTNSSPSVEIGEVGGRPGDRVFPFSIRVALPFQHGQFQTWSVIRTNDPVIPERRIPVMVCVQPAVVAEPSRLLLRDDQVHAIRLICVTDDTGIINVDYNRDLLYVRLRDVVSEELPNFWTQGLGVIRTETEGVESTSTMIRVRFRRQLEEDVVSIPVLVMP